MIDAISLTMLAQDTRLIAGADPPRFPSSLFSEEAAYLEAVDSGETAAIDSTRAAFGAGIEALMASDSERLAALIGRPERDAEREFLRARLAVLGTRLELLSGTGTYLPPDLVAAPGGPAPIAPANGSPQANALGRGQRPSRNTADRPGRLRSVWGRLRSPHADALPDEEVKPRHRNDIQGLRAVAVLLVALSHAGVGFLKGGFVGVDVFFVLSGYLITGLLFSEARRRRFVSLGDFYMRRARRILPAALLTLAATDIAAYSLLNFVRAKEYLQDSVPSALFVANIHFSAQGTNYFAQGQPPSPFQHFWSLAVEEQFYIVWPALFALILGLALRRYMPRPHNLSGPAIRRATIAVIAIALVSLAWSIHYTSSSPSAAYFSTPARAWELALGAALALSGTRLGDIPAGWRTAIGWAGLACILIAAVMYSASTPFPGAAALLPTVGAGLVIAAGVKRTTKWFSVASVLSITPMRFVGDRSYAFYLWHWPFLVIATQHAGHDLSVGTNLLWLLAAFATSMVSYQLWEQPIRRAEWASTPTALVPFTAGVAVVIVLATSFVSNINDREARDLLATQKATPVLSAAPTVASPSAGAGSTASSSASSFDVSLTVPAVAAEVRAEGHRRAMPALNPPLGSLLNDYFSLPSGCYAHTGESSSNLCRLGDSASSRTIAAFGDSHMEMWIPNLERVAQQEHYAIVPVIKSGCTPGAWVSAAGSADCHAWFKWAIAKVAAMHPDVSVIAGHYTLFSNGRAQFDAPLANALNALLGGIKKASKRVMIIGDVPGRQGQPVDCLLRPHATPASCTTSVTGTQGDLAGEVAQIAQDQHVAFVDTFGWFCYQQTCPLVIGNLIAYRDDNHVSKTYAAALDNVFLTAFNGAIAADKRNKKA